jgi:NTP pyrophosphatase (non-canonical NTP hydrolase)
MLMREYMDLTAETDRLPAADVQSVLLGLFGEVGSIMASAKKLKREGVAYVGYREVVEEEFGDALWYLTALCRRLGVGVDEILAGASRNGNYRTLVAANDRIDGPLAEVSTALSVPSLEVALLELGKASADLLTIAPGAHTQERLESFADSYLHALQSAEVRFADVVRMNLRKVRGRFLTPVISDLPRFDDGFPDDERLPAEFEITIRQRKSGRTYLQWNGVFIGDPLTDQIRDPDGYRFHDAIHFAHAAVLHWSPTFRGLIKHKRKSDPKVDEAQDGGRAIVVEEGLSAWIFSRAKQLNLFEGQRTVSLDLLKVVGQFVSGYEVEACPLKLWEDAILQGYGVFRQLRANNGGIVVGNRASRKVDYKPL